MPVSVAYFDSLPASASPYRLLDERGLPVPWANRFLDLQRLLQRSPRSLRTYAFGLLHFARWLGSLDPPSLLAELSDSLLQDYVRYQLDQQPPPTARTINHRLGVVRRLYRCLYERELPGQERFGRPYTTRSPLGYGRPRRAMASGVWLREPKKVMLPLTAAEVAQFWESFRTFRDLALVGLLLQDGLRSGEALALQVADVGLSEGQMLVRGKGNRQRILPLPPDIREALQKYLWLERPPTKSPALFVCLKGPRRGAALSLAGLRSLFRHHRRSSNVPQANPHRFRHTFGADMVRAGIALPALQKLMGHAQIRTTMWYVELAPEDVWREYRNALDKRKANLRPLDSDHV